MALPSQAHGGRWRPPHAIRPVRVTDVRVGGQVVEVMRGEVRVELTAW
jgi:hypothetical protein